jgi:hypothetical protein
MLVARFAPRQFRILPGAPCRGHHLNCGNTIPCKFRATGFRRGSNRNGAPPMTLQRIQLAHLIELRELILQP